MTSTAPNGRTQFPALAFVGLSLAVGLTLAGLGAPVAGAQTTDERVADLRARFAGGDDVTINIFRWSTDEERDELIAGMDPAARAEAAAQAEAGGGGRGGRGGRGGGDDPPEDPLVVAIDALPTLGYIWTQSVSGFAIKYAALDDAPGGGERIVLVTRRRLEPRTPSDDEFTLIELRLGNDGTGIAKAAPLEDAGLDRPPIALADYDALPGVLESVRRE